MAIVTATEVTIYTDISCSAGTTTLTLLIPIVQERINHITNNYFVTDQYIQGCLDFASAAGTITASLDWDDYGFRADDEIYIYNSYRNDGYKTIGSVTSSVLTVASTSSVTNELSGRSILVSVVSWPNALKYIAAQMIKYDYDDRPQQVAGVKSYTLGPYSVTNASSVPGGTPYGYPQELIDGLTSYTVARLN